MLAGLPVQELTREQVLEMLTRAYESAVVLEAKRRGGSPRNFLEAAAMLPDIEVFRAAFRRQVDDLK